MEARGIIATGTMKMRPKQHEMPRRNLDLLYRDTYFIVTGK